MAVGPILEGPSAVLPPPSPMPLYLLIVRLRRSDMVNSEIPSSMLDPGEGRSRLLDGTGPVAGIEDFFLSNIFSPVLTTIGAGILLMCKI
jgi:hypothetical protein